MCQILLTLLRCVAMKRALSSSTEADHLNFFKLYDGCLTDVAVLSWIKVFGGREGHWRRCFTDIYCKDIQIELEKLVDGDAGYEKLRNEIKNYRDTYVAHHDLDVTKRAKSHISLDPLKETGEVMYARLFEFLKERDETSGLPLPSQLSGESAEQIVAHWSEIALVARLATSEFTDDDSSQA